MSMGADSLRTLLRQSATAALAHVSSRASTVQIADTRPRSERPGPRQHDAHRIALHGRIKLHPRRRPPTCAKTAPQPREDVPKGVLRSVSLAQDRDWQVAIVRAGLAADDKMPGRQLGQGELDEGGPALLRGYVAAHGAA